MREVRDPALTAQEPTEVFDRGLHRLGGEERHLRHSHQTRTCVPLPRGVGVSHVTHGVDVLGSVKPVGGPVDDVEDGGVDPLVDGG
ncbi:hypothetical protein GCM10029964_001280 [Kibdelosporangium lantanae]